MTSPRLYWEQSRRQRLAVLEDQIASLKEELDELEGEYTRLLDTEWKDVAAEEQFARAKIEREGY